MPSYREPATVDPRLCGGEATHRPGAVQPYGALLVVEPEGGRILHASSNTADVLGVAAPDLLGRPIAAVAPLADSSLIAAARALGEGQSLDWALALAQPLQLTIHRHAGRLLWELEPATPAAEAIPSPAAVEGALARAGTLHQACQAVVEEVFRATAYDRVMAYRLLPDQSGDVVAEARDPRFTPFLGMRFSAQDFPPQAQRLQRVVGVRIVPNTGAAPVDLLGTAGAEDASAVDLTPVGLRAVSPFCLEYHRAIGVGATLTASVEVAGRLWGILSCHAEAPYRPDRETREAMRRLGRDLGAALERLDREAEARDTRNADRRARRLDALVQEGRGNPLLALVNGAEAGLDLLGAEGVALVAGDRLLHLGHTPPPEEIPSVLRTLAAAHAPGSVIATTRAGTLAEVGEAQVGEAWVRRGASTMAVVLSAEPLAGVLFFRPELRRDIVWCGDPARPVTRDLVNQLHPRASFERWHEQVRGEGRPWRSDAAALLARLLGPLPDDREAAAAAVAEAIAEAAAHGRPGQSLPAPDGVLLTLAEDASGDVRVTAATGACGLLFGLDAADLDAVPATAVLAGIGLPDRVLALPDAQPEEHRVWSPLLGLRAIRVTLDTLGGSRGGGGNGWTRVRRMRLDDVTEFARTIEGLEAARQRLLAADRARTSAMASMTHELRTPLNAILGFSEIIKNEMMGPVGTAAYRGYADDIHSSGHHLLSLINEVPDLSRIEAGRRLLAEDTIQFGDLAREAFHWTQTQFRDKGLDWTLSVPEDPIRLRGDATAVRQVLVNLLGNAGKYTPPGRSVGMRCRAMADGTVECEVVDTGPGIPPADLPYVTRPYFRSQSPDTVKVDGTGLGLSICKALMDMHGGTLELTSDGKTGTRARMTLPAWRRIGVN